MKKNIINSLGLFFTIIILYACNSDIEKNYLSMPEDGKFILSSSKSELILSAENASIHTAVEFRWDSLTYSVSTPVIYTLQMDSVKGDFSNPAVVESAPEGKYMINFTDSVLNNKLLSLLKLKGNTESQIKVRLKANLHFGNNPVYSNVITLKVTPYELKKAEVPTLYMPGLTGGDWNNYSAKICSPLNDGYYEGFISATQWANFKFTNKPDGSGKYYGSVANSLYSLSSASDCWNLWFDEGGYFLVKADINNMKWSRTAIKSFAVTGEFNGWSLTANPMTYDENKKVWTAVCNINTTLWGIQIIANQEWSFKYGDKLKDGSLTFGGDNIEVLQPGTYTITMDLSNPEKYIYTIK